MSDIFISYASEDRDRVEPLAKVLEENGWSVWWDRRIPTGKRFAKVIEEALSDTKAVVVLWTVNSVDSDWVQNEAAEGLRRNILLPVLMENVDIPFEFRRIQAASLINWHSQSSHEGFERFIHDVIQMVGNPLKKPKKPKGRKKALRSTTPAAGSPSHKKSNNAKVPRGRKQTKVSKKRLSQYTGHIPENNITSTVWGNPRTPRSFGDAVFTDSKKDLGLKELGSLNDFLQKRPRNIVYRQPPTDNANKEVLEEEDLSVEPGLDGSDEVDLTEDLSAELGTEKFFRDPQSGTEDDEDDLRSW